MSDLPSQCGHKRRRDEPTEYIAWSEWAERMTKTHRQVRCRKCGLYYRWVRLGDDE